MSIGETIYKFREQAGLSQEELAHKMNVTRESVTLWETDQTVPSLESLRMLSEIFAVSLDELCGTPVKGVATAPSNKEALQNNKFKALLMTMFVLSLLSLLMALIAVAISISLSPLPDFPYIMLDRVWIFFIFIPLPLASAILGIIFRTKNYKCKKNIIAGIMMCTFLGIYGSFNFIFADYTLHDFGYVRELEQTISINLPDSGYISRAINTTPATNTFAMIKFDNADEVSNTLFHDNRFSEVLSFIPANFIDSYYMNLTWKSHYYMLFDVTSNEVNVMPHSQSEVHRYIFIAYNMHKNILFVLDFMK